MFSAMHRRLGLWLVSLFAVAQVFGVVSLMNSHAVHVAEVELAIFDSGTRAGHDGHHYHGDADGAVQHHELNDLSGAFLGLAVRSERIFVTVRNIFASAQALPEPAPTRLERPPKTFLSI